MKSKSWSWLLVLNVVVLSLAARAENPPYELVRVENNDFRDWTSAELLERLGVTREDLEPYRCDGKREYAVLPELLRTNPLGDSLRVQLYSPDAEFGSSEILIYRQGTFYKRNGNPAGKWLRSNPFVVHVEAALEKLAALPTGKVLLDRLAHSPYPLTIRFGRPHFGATNDKGEDNHGMEMATAIQYLVTLRRADYGFQFNRIGTGGYIDFNPKLQAEFIEADDVKRPALPHTVLAHEMFHAFDGIRGLFDRRLIKGAAYETTEVMEYRGTYMENQIRTESGLQFRKYYGQTPSTGSLLGDDGKPMLLPTPCLN